jgi:hypothetical protein
MMVDPFDSLRRDAEEMGSTAIDARFRADLLAEAHRRLTATSTDSIRPRATADTPTPIPMEPINMLAKQPKQTRRTLLVAASLAIIVGGIVALVAINDSGDDRPPSATRPPDIAPVTTTTDAAPLLSDAAIADAVLLGGDEYSPGWVGIPNGSLWPAIDSTIAGDIPECAPFVDSVFVALEAGASTFRTFFHFGQPEAGFTQYVAVLPDAADARAVYELVNSAEFAPCVSAYGSLLDGGQSPSAFPSPVDESISDPPFAPVGDELTYRTFTASWHDLEGTHGPRTYVDAVMLVDRTITFVGTATDAEGGATLSTVDQFHSALERIAERATAALAGSPIP